MATCTWNSIRSNGIAALLCAHMGFQKTLIIYGRAFTVIIIYMSKGTVPGNSKNYQIDILGKQIMLHFTNPSPKNKYTCISSLTFNIN